MKLRQIKAHHDARTGLRIAAWLMPPWGCYMPHPFQQEGNLFDDEEPGPAWFDDDCDDGAHCTHCGGEGYREVDDPLWDDCDEFGYGECDSCSGTGLRIHQTVF